MIIENKKEKYLLIGDLHLGLTSEWRRKGVSAYSQVKDFIKKISEMKKQTKASHLVLIGDVKHKVTGISWQEEREIPEFLSLLEKMFKKVIIIKGNHDGHIEKLVKMTDLSKSAKSKENKIRVVKSLVIGDYFITHGHRNIKTKKPNIIIGHNQPSVRFKDRIGAYYVMQCWVVGKLKITGKNPAKGKEQELIIIPAFNPLSGSTVVNKNELLGPIAKHLDRSTAHVFLLDGTDLGTIKDLE